MRTTYNKIVRDKIPQIVESQGKKCTYISEEDSEISHLPALRRKLTEEIVEFNNTCYVQEELEELGDIIDVCYTIAKHLGFSAEALDEIRTKKKEEKGDFDKLIFLYAVED